MNMKRLSRICVLLLIAVVLSGTGCATTKESKLNSNSGSPMHYYVPEGTLVKTDKGMITTQTGCFLVPFEDYQRMLK